MERVIVTPATPGTKLKDYLSLTKPRIIVLLAITAYCAMIVASRRLPPIGVTMNTLLGLSLSVAGAHAINMWFDQDIDGVMNRTRNRPIPAGRMPAKDALTFGICLEALSIGWLLSYVNPEAALYSFLGFLFYVLVYTVWLKRRSPQNIVIGGAAGSFPPLVGWMAVSPHPSLVPWLMFGTIFLWTPPHFWALALYKREDYQRAGIPMLPIVSGEQKTLRQMVIYAALLIPMSLSLYWAWPALGMLYLVLASALGLWFLRATLRLFLHLPAARPQTVFFSSLLYMAGIFTAMVMGIMCT